MIAPYANKSSPKHSARSGRGERATLGRSVLVYAVSIFVAALIGASLWVSVAAINQKIHLARGMNQIIDVVELARSVAEVEHSLGTAGREDLLLRLARMGQIDSVGDNGGLKTITNPWGGALVAYTLSGQLFHIENVVPSRICSRIINLLTGNIHALGLQQIDAKNGNNAWRQIYSANNRGQLSENEIAAGCGSDAQVILALNFSLR